MCANFLPASVQAIQKIVNKDLPPEIAQHTSEVFPRGRCPIIINPQGDNEEVVIAEFGLCPEWAKEPVSYSTHNARLETISSLRTYKKAYRKSQFCLVPMQAFYEPYYPEGKNIWQSIHRQDGEAFTVPAIYEYNYNFDKPIHSFSLLTVNADNNELMNRFHKPESEKRSIQVVDPQHREMFLVANWKFNSGYFKHLDDEYTHLDKA